MVLGVVAALFGLAACTTSSLDPNTSLDNRRFDRLQAAFDEDPAVFETAVAPIEGWIAANPAADRISWIYLQWCTSGADQPRTCTDTTAGEQQVLGGLPNPDAIVYQSKDPGRIFFRFDVNDPPVYHVMYAPGDTDPAAYAEERGFRSFRVLLNAWTILGPIPDNDRYSDQFPVPE